MKTLCILSELYYPETTSTGYFVTGIAEGLAESNSFPVRVLCAQPGYVKKGEVAPKEENRKGVQIYRISAARGDKNRLPGRLWNMISLTARYKLLILKRVHRGDHVLVLTNPPTLPFLCIFMCFLKGAKTSLLVHDLYPDVLVPAGLLKNESGFAYRMMQKIQIWMLHRMKHVVVLGRDMRDRLQAKSPKLQDRLEIIPNWGEPHSIRPGQKQGNPVRKACGLEGKFIVQFSGNLGRTHGVEDLLALAESFRDHPQIHFLVFGWGAGRTYVEEQIEKRQLENFTLLPPCPMDELGYHLTACDLFLLPMKAGMEGISVPSRLYNVMAAGNPVLAVTCEISELAQVVREEKMGWVVPPGDLEGMRKAVLTAWEDTESLLAMGMRARKALEKKYTRDQVIKSFEKLFITEMGERYAC